MSRPRKYTTELLKTIVAEFVETKNSLTKITPTELAEYCRENLCMSVTYQTFTRNSEIMDYITTINQKYNDLVVSTTDTPSVIPDTLIDIQDVINHCNDKKEMQQFLVQINSQIAKLSDLYTAVSAENKMLREKNLGLEEKITVLKKEMGTQDVTRTQIRELKLQVSNLKKIHRQTMTYLNEYIYTPVVLSHLQDLQLLASDPVIETPSGIDALTDNGADIITDIEKYDTIKRNTVCTSTDVISEVPEPLQPISEDIISPESLRLAEEFQNL